jgi:hypothetical protein
MGWFEIVWDPGLYESGWVQGRDRREELPRGGIVVLAFNFPSQSLLCTQHITWAQHSKRIIVSRLLGRPLYTNWAVGCRPSVNAL